MPKTWEARLSETINFINTANFDRSKSMDMAKLAEVFLKYYVNGTEQQRVSKTISLGGDLLDNDAKKPLRALKRAMILIQLVVEKRPLQSTRMTAIQQTIDRLDAQVSGINDKRTLLEKAYEDLIGKQAAAMQKALSDTTNWATTKYSDLTHFQTYFSTRKDAFLKSDNDKRTVSAVLLIDTQGNADQTVNERQLLVLLRMIQGETLTQILTDLQPLGEKVANPLHYLVTAWGNLADLAEANRLLPSIKTKYEQSPSPYKNQPHPQNNSKRVIFQNATQHLIVHNIVQGVPEDRSNRLITGADAEQMMSLGRRVVWIVRSLCLHGTFNNRLKLVTSTDPEKEFWEEYHEKNQLLGPNKYRFLVPLADPAKNAPAYNPKWLLSRGDTLWQKLAGNNPDIVTDMAAYGRATYINQGGVCAQISHLTMGLLTLLAPPGSILNLVFHKFDHSFVLIAKDTTDWFIVDPWIGATYVCPLRYAYFIRERIHTNTRIEVVNPVDVPYGISFSNQQIQSAIQTHKPKPSDSLDIYQNVNKRKLLEASIPDHAWHHTIALDEEQEDETEEVKRQKADRRKNIKQWKESNFLVANLEEWGDVVFDAVKRRLEQAVKSLPLSIAQSLSTANLFPHFTSELNYALSNEPILLNGMKVIFDQPVGVYPVNLESKKEARRNET
jgi:hypothetical protein